MGPVELNNPEVAVREGGQERGLGVRVRFAGKQVTDLRPRTADYVGAATASDPLISPALADLTGRPLPIQAGSHEVPLDDDALRLAAHPHRPIRR